MNKYYLEIDYEPVYDIESITDGICNYTTVDGVEAQVSIEQEINYREFVPFVVEDLSDLRKLLNTKDIKIVSEEGFLVDYVEDTIWDTTEDLLDWGNNIIDLSRRGVVGKFSKIKTCKLKKFVDML